MSQVTDSDPEPNAAHVVVVVTVEDVNDNTPMFVQQPFHTLVSAEAKQGDVVKKVRIQEESESLEKERTLKRDKRQFAMILGCG